MIISFSGHLPRCTANRVEWLVVPFKKRKIKKGESLNPAKTPTHNVFRSYELDTVAGLAKRIFLRKGIVQ
tara:strand:- start:812 stop:1021 length:210 start_codon:yes stop_codon:yes gene_type:complete